MYKTAPADFTYESLPQTPQSAIISGSLEKRQKTLTASKKKCISTLCANQLSMGDLHCPDCGKSQIESDETIAALSNSRTCPNTECDKTDLALTDRFCTKCGTALQGDN